MTSHVTTSTVIAPAGFSAMSHSDFFHAPSAADASLSIDDSRDDSAADFDTSFQTAGTQQSAYTLNDGDTTFDDDSFNDSQQKVAGTTVMDLDGREGEDDNYGLTASQIESKEKKRRRRTNKDEASVLGAVFEETAFPDVHTRTALAERLNMDLRSVSIWFQNKRQAMKKRASRYGGVDGVAGCQSQDDSERRLSSDSQDMAKKTSLRRWASLDDVAGRGMDCQIVLPSSQQLADHDQRVRARETQRRVTAMMEPRPMPTERKSCVAPLLDALRRCRGNKLARIVSLPSQPAQSDESDESKVKSIGHNDLRELLLGAVAVKPSRTMSLQRSASMMHLSGLSQAPEESFSAPSTQTSKGSASTSADVISPDQIWKRMVSSSSSGTFNDSDLSTGVHSEDSDKENTRGTDAYCEDEEHTLRKIANKRAAREKAKLEQKLSSQGAKYLQEADARIVLQQRQTKEESRRPVLEPLGPRRMPSTLSGDAASVEPVQRSALSRVASLDLSAGRDRSKAPGKALMQIMDEFERERQRRLARRVAAERQAKDEAEARAARLAKSNSALRRVHSTPNGAHGQESATRTLHQPAQSHFGEHHANMTTSMPRLPQLVRSASGSLSLRPPTRPLTRVLSSGHLMPGLMARHLEGMPRLSSYGGQHYGTTGTTDLLSVSRNRQSLSASGKSSRSSSDDGASDSWTERWAREQRSTSVRSSSERDRSHDETVVRGGGSFAMSGMAANTAVKRRQSGNVPAAVAGLRVFEDDDAENNENAVPSAAQTKKRRVETKTPAPLGDKSSDNVMRTPLRALGNRDNRTALANVTNAGSPSSAASSSPYKRSNERDRLAAETLLGLGFGA